MPPFDNDETTKLRAWTRYLTEGGLDRPVDAIPFSLISTEDSLELTELLGGVLTLAVISGPDRAAEAVEGFLGSPNYAEDVEEDFNQVMDSLPLSEALERLEATDEMLTNSTAFVGLLALWFSGEARPIQPGHTLRKMILEPDKSQWEFTKG